MKPALFALGCALALAGCAASNTTSTTSTSTSPSVTPTPASPTPTAAFTPDIKIHGSAFDPASYPEDLGGVVAWQNLDGASHTVTADDGSFDSGTLATGAGFNFTTVKAGTIAYHCKIHSSMHGSITVTAPAATPSTTTTTTTTTPPPTTTTPSPSSSTPTTTTTTTPAPTTAQVAISGFAFDPRSLQVARGTTVTWTNSDSTGHTATSDTMGIFDSGRIGKDGTFSFTFNTAGTFRYHCAFHPTSMTASVVVS